jgi:GTPase SAR1 family protein
MVGLDAAGKTTILYKLKLGEIVTTIPTIGKQLQRLCTRLCARQRAALAPPTCHPPPALPARTPRSAPIVRHATAAMVAAPGRKGTQGPRG